MIKLDEIAHPESCFNKASDNERLFVLLARDPAAPFAIRAWATARIAMGKNSAEDAHIIDAVKCADLMEAERAEIESSRRQQKMDFAQGITP